MAKSYKFHCNLTSKNFPFSCEELSSTVFINQGREQNRQLLQGFDGRDVVDSFGICQTWFMSNVLPITRGYSSVYYKKVLDGFNDVDFGEGVIEPGQVADSAIEIKEEYNKHALMIPCFGGALIYDPQLLAWVSHKVSGYSEGLVTHTYLKGRTYICFAGTGLFYYDFDTQLLTQVPLVGVSGAAMLGVSSILQYLVLWNSEYIFWSSAFNPLDFVPSISVGSGSSKLLAQRGNITTILPVNDGAIIYTTVQAIACTYSGSAIDPFIFSEIPNSAGVANADHVAYNVSSDTHVAWTVSGFQAVAAKEAQQIWPELSDSIAREIYTGFSTSRTFDRGEFPIHVNDRDEFAGDQEPATGVLVGGVYPFHVTDATSAATVIPAHVNWHQYLINQPELTRASVPTRIDWKGPMRVKVSSVGSRYIAVSIGVEQDKSITLQDAGIAGDYNNYTDTAPTAHPGGDDPLEYMEDPTPAHWDQTTSVDEGALSKKSFDFAYIFDNSLNRWGRIDCEHVDIFEFSAPTFIPRITYKEMQERETAAGTPAPPDWDSAPEGLWAYQQFQSSTTYTQFLSDGVSDYWNYNSYIGLNPDNLDPTYASLGIEKDLTTAKFGETFGILATTGSIYQMKLFDGKYFKEVQATDGYDAATALMRQTDDSELGLNTLPHLIHGRYKVTRDSGALLHTVSFSKIAASGLASVWAIPHAEDGGCLAPIAFSNIASWQQDAESLENNTVAKLRAGPTLWDLAYHLDMHWAMGEHGRFGGRAAGDSVSILLAGHFTLTDLVVDVEACGNRNAPSASLDPDNTYWWYIREILDTSPPETYPPLD